MGKVNIKKVGKNIQKIRKDKGLSQERLAELVKKTRNYIGMVERAEINIPLKVLLEIAQALDVDPKEFFEV